MRAFPEGLDASALDRRAYLAPHGLLGHPALSLSNLAAVVPRLPASDVFHSNGRLDLGDSLDSAHLDHRPAERLEEAIGRLREVQAYIMVRSPERDPSFRELHEALCADMNAHLREAGQQGVISDAKLYLFIASPNAVTPFHIDRYSTFLLQFRGTKEVTVFPPWDPEVVSDLDTERYVTHDDGRPRWRPEAEPRGHAFTFHPGQALHIPFVAGHHVRNGADDVSISMSVIFRTPETRTLTSALNFNRRLRRLLGPLAARVHPIRPDDAGSLAKGKTWDGLRRLAGRQPAPLVS
ncbi:MAG: cupin-like domain-containing protein [Silanimonas sp.]